MLTTLIDVGCVAGAVALVVTLLAFIGSVLVKRSKQAREIGDDPGYVASLTTLSEASVRRHFDPYADIDWNAPELAVTADDPRWVLSDSDPLGRHPWYRAQPLDKQIEIGLWRQANIAKVTLQFESMLIRGLIHYASWVPNGSPEHRYCLHESVEECNHVLMFQELVNRIGVDVPGMRRWMRWVSPLLALYAGPFPNVFFFGVLAGEVPVDVIQTNALREPGRVHPLVEKVMAIHVAEESRHISFADSYLRKRVPGTWRINRFWMSLYVPVVFRMLAGQVLVPPRGVQGRFSVPRSVRKTMFGGADASARTTQAMFADVRMLCHEVGLMNPAARLVWRMCRIDGRRARYRSEPQRTNQPA
ncbi:diiron oxygenase [Mycobacterium sp. M1]|uniref:Diiron oxygenase n=1 Tax=Mycolicibacter acidiphilus TaxID=2835306 RepID=A0ABS5RDI4_9MYCO|nr:diiron oxygenase [Mycolicibacter acidiphilus]MBS9532345.1 diiron oxygenase [Mycolicibacter acidiphilus]